MQGKKWRDSEVCVWSDRWVQCGVGLHQGSTLSLFLFAVVMDRLTDEVGQESSCVMFVNFFWELQVADKLKELKGMK